MRGPARSPIAALALVIAVAALAACGQAAATAPVGTGVGSGSPVVVPTPVGGGQGEETVTIQAKDIAFTPERVSVSADTPVRLVLENRDQGVPHSLMVTGPSGAVISKTQVVTGPGRVELGLDPLAAGTYTFSCEVHPNMTGTLQVGP